MAKFAKLSYDGESVEFPLVEGTEDELGIDIKTLRAATNLITLDPGFKNTGSCQSAITFLDGENGILRYRGYSIEDLANNASFLEVSYLLIFGELPNNNELNKFLSDIQENAIIDEDLKKILDIAKSLEKEALSDPYFTTRRLYPNVDFYSGIIYKALNIPKEMFTVMFALGRVPGWIAHWKEMRLNKEPIGRPRQIYIGENQRAFLPLNKR